MKLKESVRKRIKEDLIYHTNYTGVEPKCDINTCKDEELIKTFYNIFSWIYNYDMNDVPKCYENYILEYEEFGIINPYEDFKGNPVNPQEFYNFDMISIMNKILGGEDE